MGFARSGQLNTLWFATYAPAFGPGSLRLRPIPFPKAGAFMYEEGSRMVKSSHHQHLSLPARRLWLRLSSACTADGRTVINPNHGRMPELLSLQTKGLIRLGAALGSCRRVRINVLSPEARNG